MTDSLAVLDVLPPHCSLVADADGDHVRFQAVDADGRLSLWSGWFPVAAAPIRLSWVAFDFEAGDG